MAIMIYALYTYHWRAASIRRGGRGPYDDRVGPVCNNAVMSVCFLLIMRLTIDRIMRRSSQYAPAITHSSHPNTAL
jgi:hypothetical protein